MRIRVHPGLCDGHGLCHRFAPEVYHLDEEGYIGIHLLEVPPELESAARLGASVCPAGAITIVSETPAEVRGADGCSGRRPIVPIGGHGSSTAP